MNLTRIEIREKKKSAVRFRVNVRTFNCVVDGAAGLLTFLVCDRLVSPPLEGTYRR